MKCPNCQKKFKTGVKCSHCNVDTVLYMGTMRLSDKLYNRGLERLKVGDFFHGTDALTKSITINKNNVPSRNLLGLALFEVGHIGEALKHWVISQSMLKNDNPATKYIESANENARQLERLNNAVAMYNQALAYIKQKSDDLAIIQLKKAIEINPHFVDALNLLTLCYLIQNDRERAIAVAERVLACDVFNPVALKYYAILNPGKKPTRTPIKVKKEVPKAPYKAIGLEEKKPLDFHFAELFTFVIGVVITVAACYFLLIPAINRSHLSEIQLEKHAHADTRAEFQQQLNQAENEKNEMEQEILRLGEEIHSVNENLSVQQRINEVNRAYFLYLEETPQVLRDAVNRLEGLDRTHLPPDIQSRIDVILESAYPRLGLNYYNLGLAAFNAPRDLHLAHRHLNDAYRFLNENATQWNRLLFMLATLHYADNNIDEAYCFLTQLRDRAAPNFPNFTGTERTAIAGMTSRIEAQR